MKAVYAVWVRAEVCRYFMEVPTAASASIHVSEDEFFGWPGVVLK